MAAPATATAKEIPADASEPKQPRQTKPKFTFMLHDADDMSSCGKYSSSDYRYAALKAASKGSTRILLRKTNSKEVREFTGSIVTLDTPKEINRGNRVIKYSKKPCVRFVRKFTFAGDIDSDEAEGEGETAEEGAGDQADKADTKPKRKPVKRKLALETKPEVSPEPENSAPVQAE